MSRLEQSQLKSSGWERTHASRSTDTTPNGVQVQALTVMVQNERLKRLEKKLKKKKEKLTVVSL